MEQHPLAQFAKPKPTRREQFVYGGVTHTLAGRPFGDDFFAVMFIDSEVALSQCAHFAAVNSRVVNGRPVAYPLDIYPDVLAILRTYERPAGAEDLDPSLVFALYDNEPALFAQLRAKALIAIGISDLGGLNSGKTAWQGLFVNSKRLEKLIKGGEMASDEQAAKEAVELIEAMRRASKLALLDYSHEVDDGEEGEDDPRDVVQLMEEATGNSLKGP